MKVIFDDYIARIAVATPLQLVVINYEIVIDYLNTSRFYLDKDKKEFEFNIKQSRKFLTQLRNSLNMSYEISYKLMSIYNYIDKIIAKAIFSKNKEELDFAIKIMKKLLKSWILVQEKEVDKLDMQNCKQIFSGLTYNKEGQLNEYIYSDIKKDYKA